MEEIPLLVISFRGRTSRRRHSSAMRNGEEWCRFIVVEEWYSASKYDDETNSKVTNASNDDKCDVEQVKDSEARQ